jgi:hypothetical protein
MLGPRLRRTFSVALLALACGLVASGCGEHEPGVDEPAREGLAIDVDGIEYNVFLTRELNLQITPDRAYYNGPEAIPGRALYGLFLESCNPEGEPRTTTEEFVVEDNQGNEFEPLELEEENAFAYQAVELGEEDCQPAPGSVAEQGPAGGSMLLFDFPLESLENRPLELVIGSGEGSKRVELDL